MYTNFEMEDWIVSTALLSRSHAPCNLDRSIAMKYGGHAEFLVFEVRKVPVGLSESTCYQRGVICN